MLAAPKEALALCQAQGPPSWPGSGRRSRARGGLDHTVLRHQHLCPTWQSGEPSEGQETYTPAPEVGLSRQSWGTCVRGGRCWSAARVSYWIDFIMKG